MYAARRRRRRASANGNVQLFAVRRTRNDATDRRSRMARSCGSLRSRQGSPKQRDPRRVVAHTSAREGRAGVWRHASLWRSASCLARGPRRSGARTEKKKAPTRPLNQNMEALVLLRDGSFHRVERGVGLRGGILLS